ncbi:MAG: site-specific DNA-methyltransferase [Chloroflexota bacterium]|nr:site-specific DNA-methyltransferase [Chloroflexota bacterium]
MAKQVRAASGKPKPLKQFVHPDKKRANNPPVGLVTSDNDPDGSPKQYAFDPHRDPQLVWAGKAERTSFEVPTVSLHVHERVDPKTILDLVRRKNGGNGPVQQSLFTLPEENPPSRTALDFYKHPHGWSNRLVAGDSLLIMNSLLEKEGLAGQIQMIYIDPPYGVNYGSNFQPFVDKKSVAPGDKDEDLTAEPEMIRAFRDTWELDIHSYVTYLRDRLLLAKELLNESGSIFVQISDENLHLVRLLLDEVFGAANLVVTIPVKKKGSQRSGLLDPVNDYILWYARSPRKTEATKIKFRALFRRRELDAETLALFKYVQLPDGRDFLVSSVPVADGEQRDYRLSPRQLFRDYPGARLFTPDPLTGGGEFRTQSVPFTYLGKSYPPGRNQSWKHSAMTDDGTPSGMDKLAAANRLFVGPGQLRFKRYLDDFGHVALSNWWDGLGGASDPIYVVQTNPEIIERCMLMTTDPGDLVFDPTCGSGTTAYVAEKWGRRWITCDTSRVAVTLAKGRLMTSSYPYYELAHPDEGVSSGFRYKTVAHTSSSTIANDEPPIQETLYDDPHVDSSKARVTGPFTVEAVPSPVVRPLTESRTPAASDNSVARSGATLRHAEWRDHLLRAGIRGGRAGKSIEFSRVELLPGTRFLHAEAETKEDKPRRVVIAFGPEYAALEQRTVQLAWQEAAMLAPKPSILLFAAFLIDPEAAKDIDELTTSQTGMTLLKVQMDMDLLSGDLKKKRGQDQSFWLMGQPDVQLLAMKDGDGTPRCVAEVIGFDYYDPTTGTIESGDASKIAVWELDTDYDDRSLLPSQVFFTVGVLKDGLRRLARTLKAEIDAERIEAYTGTRSLPFTPGKRVAVKIVDTRGIESLKILDVD